MTLISSVVAGVVTSTSTDLAESATVKLVMLVRALASMLRPSVRVLSAANV